MISYRSISGALSIILSELILTPFERYIEDPSEADELYAEGYGISLKFLKETKVASIQHPFSSTKEPIFVSGQISNLSAIPSKSSSIREKLAVILISLSNENSNGLFEQYLQYLRVFGPFRNIQPLKIKLLLGKKIQRLLQLVVFGQ